MIEMCGRTVRYLTIGIAAILVTACASMGNGFRSTTVFDHTGKRRFVEPSVTIELSDGGTRFALTSPYFAGVTLTGIVEDSTDGVSTFYVARAHLFTNWANGWTEATYEASGVFSATPAGGGFTLSVEDAVELWSIVAGEIRYYDTYVRGDEGLARVKARIDRLTALAEWLHAESARPVFGHPDEPGTYGAAMKIALWNYVDNALADTEEDRPGALDKGAFAGGAIDPPLWLPDLYESGTVERDVREAAGLLVALYNLETMNRVIFDSITLQEF